MVVRWPGVEVFDPDTAVAYLATAIDAGDDQVDEVTLAGELGYLPLALAQAAAFIRDRGIGPDGYRSRLADRQCRLADLVPPGDALPDGYRATADRCRSDRRRRPDGRSV